MRSSFLCFAGALALSTATAARETSAPLDDRGLANLRVLARLTGLVRFFHPSDESAAADWDQLVLGAVPEVESAKDTVELERVLEQRVGSVAPTMKLFMTSAPTPALELLPAGAPPDLSELVVVHWFNHGYSATEGPQGEAVYFRERRREPATATFTPGTFADPRDPYVTELGQGLSCALPLALFATKDGPTLSNRKSPPANAPRTAPVDRSMRLGDVILAWSTLAHFYPYFDVVETDWSAALERALRSAATDGSPRAFLDTLRRLVAALKDGHGRAMHASDMNASYPAFAWDWIEGQLVITNVAEALSGRLTAGDAVRAIDGQPVAAAIAAAEELISGATPQWRRFRALDELARGAAGSRIALTIEPWIGDEKTVTVERSSTLSNGPLPELKPDVVDEPAPGIVYVDLDRIDNAEFAKTLPRLAAARGVILDLRGYPTRLAPEFLQHLRDESLTSPRWLVPITSTPVAEQTQWDPAGRWVLPPLEPRLPGHVAFITYGGAISYAESCMAIVESYRLAEIVGAPTAGTNGNVNFIRLPGNYVVIFTGMKVLRHDGSKYHGAPVQPTVPVERTREGVAQGRDEMLEKAIEVVSR